MWKSKLPVVLMRFVAAITLAPCVGAAPLPRQDVGPLLRQALEAAEAISDPHEKLSMMLRIAAVQNETGEHAGARKTGLKAVEIARGLPADRMKALRLATVAMAQAEAEDRAGATETLKLARQAADALKDANHKGIALMQVVHAQVRLGDYEGAFRTAKEAGDYQSMALAKFCLIPLRKPDKLAAHKALREAVERMKALPENDQRQYLPQLAGAQVRVEDLEGALKTIDLLGAPWKRVGQEWVAIAQAQTGDVAGALRTLKAMERAGPGGGRFRAPDQLGGRVLQAVAHAQAKAGDKAGAEATLKLLRPVVADLYAWEAKFAGRPGMSGFSQAADLEGTIALTQYQIGDLAGARRTALAIKAGREKARALLEIGEAAAAAGKRAEAREFLREAARAAESAGRAASTLWQIAEQQAKVGDVPEALRTAERMGDGWGDIALASIVPVQVTAGDVKGALQTLARIKGSIGKAKALEGLVEALVKAGDERRALAVVEEQKSPGLKARALLGLAKGRAKAKDGKK